MANPPRRHHYVQAAHLEMFACEDGGFWVYSKDGKSFPQSPGSFFWKRDLNSFETPDGIDTRFEDVATRIENDHWPTLAAIAQRGEILASDLDSIAVYLAFSTLRNPAMQIGVHDTLSKMVATVTRIVEEQGHFDDLGPNPINPRYRFSELLDQGLISVKINNSRFIKAIFDMIEPRIRLLRYGFRWSLVFSERGRVVVSDHPLNYVHPGADPGPYGIPPGGRTCEVSFPLSKHSILLGLWQRGAESTVSEDGVDELNRRQAIFANRFIASPTMRRDIPRILHRYRHYCFQFLTDSIPNGQGAFHLTRIGVYPVPGSTTPKGKHPLLSTKPIRGILRQT